MSYDKLNYLEEERKKLWGKVDNLTEVTEFIKNEVAKAREFNELANNHIETLKEDVRKKTSDYEVDAKNSATQSKKNLTIIKGLLDEVKPIKEQLDSYKNELSNISEFVENIKSQSEYVNSRKIELDSTFKELNDMMLRVAETQQVSNARLDQILKWHEEINESYNDINDSEEDIKAVNEKIINIHEQAVKRNNEIKALYDQILGYSIKDKETGEDTFVNGTKQEMEQAYSALKSQFASCAKELDDFKQVNKSSYNEFIAEKINETEEIKTQIRSLLPDAMTAGLASAYIDKREKEQVVLGKASWVFYISIFLMSVTALIPMGFSYWFIQQGKTLEDLLLQLPRIVCIIIPIYLPLFWLAYASNKNVKLSKRLIEEYSHKEALSKTFEGLSNQIENLSDSEVAIDLRARLLYNFISASAENPGKLIKDYNNSDNPILNILDKSMKLQESIEKLAGIPGSEPILKVLERFNEKKKTDAIVAAKNGLANIVEDDDEINNS